MFKLRSPVDSSLTNVLHVYEFLVVVANDSSVVRVCVYMYQCKTASVYVNPN